VANNTQTVKLFGVIKTWIFRAVVMGLALGAIIWANESTLRTAHVLNSMLAAIVVFVVFSTEIILVREAKAPLNPMTILINVVVLLFPLINIAEYYWPLAIIFIAIGALVAWFSIRRRQAVHSREQ